MVAAASTTTNTRNMTMKNAITNTMTDSEIAKSYSTKLFVEIGGSCLNLLVSPEIDIDDTFEAWCLDECEVISVEGWLADHIEVVEA